MRTAAITIVALSVVIVSSAGAQSPMREGKWEVTTQMQMADVPVQLPARTSVRCITKAQLEDPGSTLPGGSPDPTADCKVSDYKAAGSTITWKVACSGAEPMTGEGEIVVDGDRYDGTMKMTMAQGVMTMKYAAKRVGDCGG
jgi:hypothetical protein